MCVCVCVYICMYVYVYIYMCVCVFVCNINQSIDRSMPISEVCGLLDYLAGGLIHSLRGL